MPSDIFIIPNRNSTTAAPVMLFSGSQGNSIRLEVLTSGSVAFLGKSGSLFSINDNLSGSLMAVNDISGLPILEVFSDDRVVMGRFNTNALVVTGSFVGVRKAAPLVPLDVSGSVFISGSTSITGSLTVSVPSGTAATFSTPGGGFVSFTNGLIDSNSNQFGFKAGSGVAAYIGANNSQHLTVTTAGNVAIGKTTANAVLDVNGNATVTGSLSATTNAVIGTGNSTRLVLNGLGGPAAITEYYLAESFPRWAIGRDLITGGQAGIGFSDSLNTIATTGGAVAVPATRVLAFYTSNATALTERMRIDGSGNIGIAKTTPSVTLDVNGNTFITGSLNVAANTNQSITLYANGTGLVSVGNMSGAGTRTRLEIAQVGIRLFYIENTATTGHLAFGDGSGETFRMIGQGINTLLFGTTTNSNNGRLQLATHTTTGSGIGFGPDISLSRSAGDTLDFTVTSGAPTFRFMNGAVYRGYVGTNGATAVLNSQTGGVQFQTNSTVALTLDTSQNATLSGNYFYVGGAGNFYVRATGANNGLIRANIFSTDVDGDFRVRNAAGTQDYLTVDSQKAVFSGSVGLGKTPTTKLDVLGNVFITGSLSVTDGVTAPADYKNNLHPFLFITFF